MIGLECDIAEGARELALYELLRQRLVKPLAIAAPGAGVEISQVVPAGEWWEILALRATFTTSAVAGNRFATLEYVDDGNIVATVGPQGAQATTLTFLYSWQKGQNTQVFQSGIAGVDRPLPDVPLLPGGIFRTKTSGLDVGDTWTGITLLARVWTPHAVLAAQRWLEDHTR